MIKLWIETIIFFLPALVANGAPPIGKRIPILRKLYIPVYSKLLGKNKTWGGFVAASIVGSLVGLTIRSFDLYSISAVSAGLCLGFFSCLGDSLGSFIKRKSGFKEGEFVFYDWMDWLIGAWIITPFIGPLSFVEIGLSLTLVCMVGIMDYFSYKFTPFKDEL